LPLLPLLLPLTLTVTLPLPLPLLLLLLLLLLLRQLRIFAITAAHLFGDQVPNQNFPIKTLASVAPRHDDWAIQKLLPREVLFQAVISVDQWLKSMLISKS
jgi:hypothetical protein